MLPHTRYEQSLGTGSETGRRAPFLLWTVLPLNRPEGLQSKKEEVVKGWEGSATPNI